MAACHAQLLLNTPAQPAMQCNAGKGLSSSSPPPKGSQETRALLGCLRADEEKAGLARRRATLRLLLELLLAGLYTTHATLLGIVRQLASADFSKDLEGGQASLALLGVLAKAGRVEALGLPPALPAAVPSQEMGAQQEVRRPLGCGWRRGA
jgi:hypothetical protein